MDQLETGEVPEAAQAVSDLQNELAERQHWPACDGAGACEPLLTPWASSRPQLPMKLNSRSARCPLMPKPLCAC